MVVLADSGPGRPSVDAALLPSFKGSRWALASLGAAVAGSYLADVLNEQVPEQQAGPPQAAGAGDPTSTEEARFTKEQASAATGS
jgi:hypothetical protein